MVNKDDENKSYNYFSLGGSPESNDSGLPQDDDFPFYSSDDVVDDPEEACWMFKSIATLMSLPKPLGTMFSYEQEKDFLEKLGYKVEEIKCSEDINPTGFVRIATKKGDKIDKKDKEDLSKHSVGQVFVEEFQRIILNWLLKISREE